MYPGIVVRRQRWRQLKIIKSRCLLNLPRLPAAVAIRAAVILPILLANIATAPVASDPEPFDVVRRFVVPPFVAIRAAVALAFQQSSGVLVRTRCHVRQARTSLDASRTLVMLGLSSQTTMVACYNCHNNKPYTITHKTTRTWRRNQPPFDTHDNGRASCYILDEHDSGRADRYIRQAPEV